MASHRTRRPPDRPTAEDRALLEALDELLGRVPPAQGPAAQGEIGAALIVAREQVDSRRRALERARLERAIVAQVCHGHARDARAEALARRGHVVTPAPRPGSARRWPARSARPATG